ncbi:MAG: hypothetical protein MJ184_03050 [Treponema sp.]|uniref:hypothetical protein n=1 Tax=Treponema sp. TaxID=166 RepID=UPI00298E7348|nr:hypothetical protein [Treponema sp.]MCQ2600319.1 hypothetical protein [Treponema sp.]
MAKNPLKKTSFIVKILLVILYDIYGIVARITSGKLPYVIIGVLQIFTANLFGILWLIDLITVICKKNVTVLA